MVKIKNICKLLVLSLILGTAIMHNNLTAQTCQPPKNVMVNTAATSTATLSWDGVINSQGYRIKYRMTGDTSWSVTNTQDTFMNLANLMVGKGYELKVRNKCGNNNWSEFTKSVWFNTASVWNQSTTGDLYLANPNAKIGIGIVAPQAKIHALGGLLLEGNVGTTPISGAGTRFMFIPDKSALRAGVVNGSQWDASSIGNASIALGENVTASGANSVAIGKNISATGIGSIALGNGPLTGVANNSEANTFKIFNGGVDPIFTNIGGQIPSVDPEPQGDGPNGSPCLVSSNKFKGDITLSQNFSDEGVPCGGNICAPGDVAAYQYYANRGITIGRGCQESSNNERYRLVKGANSKLFLGRTAGAGTHPDILIATDGKVGIGTASPTQKLHLVGTSLFEYFPTEEYTTSHVNLTKGSLLNVNRTKAIVLKRQIDNGAEEERVTIFADGGAIFKGQVAIGEHDRLPPSDVQLAVKGRICSKESRVSLSGDPCWWPDYVFAPEYKLTSLDSVAQYIKEHKHLPNIPSAAEVAKEGIELGAMNAKLLEKIEELTLHLIQLKKEVEELKKAKE